MAFNVDALNLTNINWASEKSFKFRDLNDQDGNPKANIWTQVNSKVDQLENYLEQQPAHHHKAKKHHHKQKQDSSVFNGKHHKKPHKAHHPSQTGYQHPVKQHNYKLAEIKTGSQTSIPAPAKPAPEPSAAVKPFNIYESTFKGLSQVDYIKLPEKPAVSADSVQKEKQKPSVEHPKTPEQARKERWANSPFGGGLFEAGVEAFTKGWRNQKVRNREEEIKQKQNQIIEYQKDIEDLKNENKSR